jgi:hypothetical protein
LLGARISRSWCYYSESYSTLRVTVFLLSANPQLRDILQQALQPNRFPTFCALLIGGSSIFQLPLYQGLISISQRFRSNGKAIRTEYCRILARFLAALLAATISFQLINSTSANGEARLSTATKDEIERSKSGKSKEVTSERHSKIPPGIPPLPANAMMAKPPKMLRGVPTAGKTMDLTLFAFVRAVDIGIQSSTKLTSPSTRTMKVVAKVATPLLFAASSATIMHAFFYASSRLPFTYVKWIERIAELDERLLRALREARYGNFVYGKETGIGPLLGSMCNDLGLPEEWGNPARTIPLPCEVVHHGSGQSCEWHAISRFWRAWRRALGVYAPLQALILLRILSQRPKKPLKAIFKVTLDAARSSAFLGAFVSLFYYGVCLGRTRIGPKIFSYKSITPQMWDSGLCTAVGCLLCGWSVLFEITRRRVELMLFVLPRALGVWFPRRYERQVCNHNSNFCHIPRHVLTMQQHRWREQVTFALSAAVILTAAQEKPDRVRGVFGRVLGRVIAP